MTREVQVSADEALRARKRELRASMLARRNALPVVEVARLGAAIQDRLLALPEYEAARVVHSYVGVKANEVPTHRILQETLRSSRRLVVPRVDGEVLRHHEIRDVSELRQAAFGLLEPDSSAPEVDAAAIDLVVVPGLAFDRAGNRLGLGKGYYDRFLSGVRAPAAALLFSVQLIDEVPAAPRDMPVDLLVTERGVERTRRGGEPRRV